MRRIAHPLCLLLLLISLLAACDSTPVPDVEEGRPAESAPARVGGSFEEGECPFDLPRRAKVTCGTLTVPENRSRATSPSIALAVAILHTSADEGERQPDPILYLAGGPGGSALDDLSADIEGWADYDFHRDRDLLFLDQRGAGHSTPSLNCPEVEEVDYENAKSEDPEYDAHVACHARLVGEGVELAAYNTTESAADVEALRQALGYEKLNLFGVSYGTRLALTVMRDYPDGLRSVLLDSPYPPNVDLPPDEALTSMEALRALFAGCAADEGCGEAYSDLEETLGEVVERLNDSPESAQVWDWEAEEEVEMELAGDAIVNALVQAMYDVSLIPLLPRIIHDVSEGDYESYGLIGLDEASDYRPRQDEVDVSDSEGLYATITCRDDYAFSDFETVEARTEGVIPDPFRSAMVGAVESQFAQCEVWGVGRASASENRAVASDLPTLILVGEYDPVTPPRWATLTAASLSNAVLHEFPGFGHALVGDECANDLATQFFTDPLTEPDSACLDEIGPPEFFLPDDEIEFE